MYCRMHELHQWSMLWVFTEPEQGQSVVICNKRNAYDDRLRSREGNYQNPSPLFLISSLYKFPGKVQTAHSRHMPSRAASNAEKNEMPRDCDAAQTVPHHPSVILPEAQEIVNLGTRDPPGSDTQEGKSEGAHASSPRVKPRSTCAPRPRPIPREGPSFGCTARPPPPLRLRHPLFSPKHRPSDHSRNVHPPVRGDGGRKS